MYDFVSANTTTFSEFAIEISKTPYFAAIVNVIESTVALPSTSDNEIPEMTDGVSSTNMSLGDPFNEQLFGR
jgi:hypothetical protein